MEIDSDAILSALFHIQDVTDRPREIIQQCDVAKAEVEDGFNRSDSFTWTSETSLRLYFHLSDRGLPCLPTDATDRRRIIYRGII